MDERNLIRRGPLVVNNNKAELRAYKQKKEKARRQKQLEQRVDRLESMTEEILDILKSRQAQ